MDRWTMQTMWKAKPIEPWQMHHVNEVEGFIWVSKLMRSGSLPRLGNIYGAAVQGFADAQMGVGVLRAELLCNAQDTRIITSFGNALRLLLSQPNHQQITPRLLQDIHCQLEGLQFGAPGEWDSPRVTSAMHHFCTSLRLVIEERPRASSAAKAAWALYFFMAIRPFSDGNGRMARILMNYVLKRCGVPFSCHIRTSELSRRSLARAIEKARESHGRRLGPLTQTMAKALQIHYEQLQHIVVFRMFTDSWRAASDTRRSDAGDDIDETSDAPARSATWHHDGAANDVGTGDASSDWYSGGWHNRRWQRGSASRWRDGDDTGETSDARAWSATWHQDGGAHGGDTRDTSSDWYSGGWHSRRWQTDSASRWQDGDDIDETSDAPAWSATWHQEWAADDGGTRDDSSDWHSGGWHNRWWW